MENPEREKSIYNKAFNLIRKGETKVLVNALMGKVRVQSYKVVEYAYRKGWLTDKQFLRIRFLFDQRRILHLKNPRTFNEKMQWLKLYNRKEEYTDMVDKVKFKKWAAQKIGEEYIIPMLAVWDSPDDIDFSALPPKFVLKCNHVSGGVYIHTGNQAPDEQAVRALLRRKHELNYFKRGGEWPYKNVRRKILAEKYITEMADGQMPDFKFYCFGGKPLYVQVNSFGMHYQFSDSRRVSSYQAFYDMEWQKQEFIQGYPEEKDVYTEKPENFDKMVELAAILSEGIPFVRVDLYNIEGRIYVGEMTFFPYNGFWNFQPKKWDAILGNHIKLNHSV